MIAVPGTILPRAPTGITAIKTSIKTMGPRTAATTFTHRRRYHTSGVVGDTSGGSIGVDVSNLLIVSALVLLAGFPADTGLRPSWRVQPATTRTRTGRGRPTLQNQLLRAADSGDRFNPLLDTLRAIGLVRRRVDRVVVGKKAYVRWWERLRAMTALLAIVVAAGIALAVAIGVVILGAGFLLEHAIT